MTLVVARRIGTTTLVVGDTLISGGKQNLRKVDLGLKILSLDKDTMVAYAGAPEVAHGILMSIVKQIAPLDVNEVVEALKAEQSEILARTGSCGVDFIVVCRGQITQVKDAHVESDTAVAWVGDLKAFSAFQRYLAMLQNKERHGSVLNAPLLRGALENVVADQDVDSVGGPVVSVLSDEDGSRYCCYLQLHSPLNPHDEYREDGWRSMDWGNAATGGYGFATLTPLEMGISGWGMFYFQLGRGIYFSADLTGNKFYRMECSAKSADQFCRAVEKQIGYRPQFCGQLGVIP